MIYDSPISPNIVNSHKTAANSSHNMNCKIECDICYVNIIEVYVMSLLDETILARRFEY